MECLFSCSACGHARLEERVLHEHDISALLGFDEAAVMLHGFPALVCPACDAVTLTGPVIEHATRLLIKHGLLSRSMKLAREELVPIDMVVRKARAAMDEIAEWVRFRVHARRADGLGRRSVESILVQLEEVAVLDTGTLDMGLEQELLEVYQRDLHSMRDAMDFIQKNQVDMVSDVQELAPDLHARLACAIEGALEVLRVTRVVCATFVGDDEFDDADGALCLCTPPVPEAPVRAHLTLSAEGAQIVYDALTSKTCAPSPGLVALGVCIREQCGRRTER